MTETIKIIPPKGFDYINTGNPSATTNPPTALATWLNATTGTISICTDNTTDANVWLRTSVNTDWESFTLSTTITGATWTAQKRRVDSYMEIHAKGSFTGGSGGNSNITVPDSLTIASSVFGVTSFGQDLISVCDYYDASSGYHYQGTVVVLDSTTLRLSITTVQGSYTRLGSVSTTVPFSPVSGDIYRFRCFVPIAEWQ